MPRHPHLVGHCMNCGRILRRREGQRQQRRWCLDCKKIRIRRQQEESRARQRVDRGSPIRSWSNASYLASGGATHRQHADDTLEAGGQKRRCDCGRLYALDRFDSPCPDCSSQLIPLPGGPYVEES